MLSDLLLALGLDADTILASDALLYTSSFNARMAQIGPNRPMYGSMCRCGFVHDGFVLNPTRRVRHGRALSSVVQLTICSL